MKWSDYIALPDKLEIDWFVDLTRDNQLRYNEFEEEQVLQIIQEEEITGEISALSAAALTNKLLQFANGAVYDDEKNYHVVHDQKLDALEEIIEAANGENVLIFYSYRHDLERIKKRFPVKQLLGPKDIAAWNNGEINLMIAHPASAGHGLNLQAGGCIIVFFGLPWSLELYLQAVARLFRQGQTKPVTIYRLIARKTWDQKVLASLERKDIEQKILLNALKALIKEYGINRKTKKIL